VDAAPDAVEKQATVTYQCRVDISHELPARSFHIMCLWGNCENGFTSWDELFTSYSRGLVGWIDYMVR